MVSTIILFHPDKQQLIKAFGDLISQDLYEIVI